MMEIPYTSPVPPAQYGTLAVLLLLSGLTFVSLFFTQGNAPVKSISAEFLYAIIASFLLGFGTLFLFLWAEIYV